MNYRRWLIVAYLLVMMSISTSILLIPGQKYGTLTTSDSGWVYDIAEEILKNDGLVEKNPLSHAPYGLPVSFNEQLQPLLTVMVYKGVHSVNSSVTLMDVVKFWAPLFFAFSLIPIFLIGKELGGDLAGVAAVFFAAVMVSTIYWMKVGAYDREPIKLFIVSFTFFFTIKIFKAPKSEMPKLAILSGLSFGLFTLAWAGATFFAAILIGGLIFVLLAGFFGKLVRNISKVFGAVSSAIRSHFHLLIGVVGMMIVTTVVLSILGGQQPSLWIGFFQTILGYAGIGGGGGEGVSLPTYASEAQVAGPINETLSIFYQNDILTIFVIIMIGLALAKFLWSRKPWEIFVFAWLIVLLVMIYPGKGPVRFVREWWTLVPVLAGVGMATLVSLVNRASSEPSLKWLKDAQNPVLATALIVLISSPFVVNAYTAAGYTVPPTDWEGQSGLDKGLMDSFNWLRENTPEDSVVAIEWSYGHLLTGASRRPTVCDGAEIIGEEGKWEGVIEMVPPDYIYTVKDSTGTFLHNYFTINGRRTDVQRLPTLGSDDEAAFYFETYRDNYGVKIDYWVTHAFQIYDMLGEILRGDAKRSKLTNFENERIIFDFEDDNVIFALDRTEAYVERNGDKLYFVGVVILYYGQQGEITNFAYSYRENTQIPSVLSIYVPNWTDVPTYDQVEARQSYPYWPEPPLYARVFAGQGVLPDFMSVAYTSPNGFVKVIKINHTASLIYPANNASVNTDAPKYRWSGGVGATRYELVLDDDSTFESPITEVDVVSQTYTPTVALSDGSYWWRVGAYKGEKFLGWSDASTFVVDTVAPAEPQLSSPEDGTELSTLSAAFRWTKSEAGAEYQIQIDNDTGFTSPELDGRSTTENYTFNFKNNGVYNWRVRAIDVAGNRSGWSDVFTVIIRAPPQASTLSSPENGSITRINMPTFSWSGGIADDFVLLVDEDNGFGSPLIDVTLGTVDNYTPSEGLADSSYSWKVVSVVGAQRISSQVWTFEVDTVPPEAPVLLTPDDEASTTDRTPTFSWSSVTDADKYRLLVDDDPGFGSPEIDNLLSETSFTPTIELSPGTYYWHVDAIDIASNESVSVTRVFSVS